MRARATRRARVGWVAITINITKNINVLMVRGGRAVRMGPPGARLRGWSGALRGARGPAGGGRLRGPHAWTERNLQRLEFKWQKMNHSASVAASQGQLMCAIDVRN